jgi:hypothetical protein
MSAAMCGILIAIERVPDVASAFALRASANKSLIRVRVAEKRRGFCVYLISDLEIDDFSCVFKRGKVRNAGEGIVSLPTALSSPCAGIC